MPSIVVDIDRDYDAFVELIDLDTPIPVRVTGTSMLPFLHPDKDIVYVRKYKNEPLCENQIVFFKNDEGKLILHRIFEVLDDGFLRINGDAQFGCEVIKTSQVIATAEKILRNGAELDMSSEKLIRRQKIWKKLRPIRPVLIKAYKIFNRS